MTERPFQTCTRCIMDTTDPEITFDAQGVCNHCHYFDRVVRPLWHPDEDGKRQLDALVSEMKACGKGKDYDCIIGLSGGVDSSYLAYWAVKEAGLRPLVVHVDAGWNSELAVKNIENIVKKLGGVDLFTYVVDWEEMKDLQVAFLRAGVANQDIPQDHCFTAKVYEVAAQKGIKHVISGSNYATESILPKAWGYNAMDLKHLRAIHARFGKRKLKSYPMISFFKYYYYYPKILGMKVVRPLNLMPYSKTEAMRVLTEELGWRYYGGKHYESRFTKFFQGYYLPTKFGYDKRKAHLSSLIVSGEITREQALEEMKKPAYPPEDLEEDLAFVIKKFGLTRAEFDQLFHAPNKSFSDYPSNHELFVFKNRLKQALVSK